MVAEHELKAAGESPYRGWRVSLNRLVWRAHIFIVGSLVVWVERVRPGRGYGGRIFAASARFTNRLVGARVGVIGLEQLDPDQAYVFTPNHRSHLDIIALMASLPAVRFAAKRELFDEPVLGRAMRERGGIRRARPVVATPKALRGSGPLRLPRVCWGPCPRSPFSCSSSSRSCRPPGVAGR